MRAKSIPIERDDGACLRALLSKQVIPCALLFLFGWIIWQKSGELDFTAIRTQVGAISHWQWGLATAGAALSFWAIGRMDAVVHRLLDTGVGDRAAQLSGVASVATAQITGFGLLTGTLARWRVLPGIGLWKAAQITAAVSITFMVALGGLTAVMILLAGPELAWSKPAAVLGLFFIAGLVAATIWKPRWLLKADLPPLRAQATLAGLALLDTMAAALALYVLMPADVVPAPMVFYAVFLMALGVGLLGTTPGGLGPFEMMMLACFTQIPDATILAAIAAYRIVYFALPAALAVVVLVAGPWLRLCQEVPRAARVQSGRKTADRPVAMGALTFNAQRAESGLLRQGELDLLVNDQDHAVSLVAPAGQSLIMLTDPLNHKHPTAETLHTLRSAAASRFLVPCLYKCNARTAVAARRAGWRLLQVSQEAVVDPARFDLGARGCRQLRRYLRKAADVVIEDVTVNPPLREMRQLSRAWAAGRKGARGFSMGLFDETYVRAQHVYAARLDGKLVGFVSFHESWRERTLDLMCMGAQAPTGTAHALIHAAILGAKADGLARLSLAAVPGLSDRLRLPSTLAGRFHRLSGAEGLRRFKSCFDPRWEPLYLAAPGALSLALAGVDLIDRITRPRAQLYARRS
ncbi:putative membrane protein [Candidatus Rhodobacter oscarellae]|uniref:Putative membrane protein n=1 Tax=Candidatus Rhodobacter oscarellae TaxID=1675527 RepID=A0A0J9E2H8_9RHOB|nr:phosphatidylglycerol lysyltransferase domain-containing protein [Candidatus Rhodobacter lobularis]KMW56935.1 putative membrane protein [Candidatus Rhodobacter lobularis]